MPTVKKWTRNQKLMLAGVLIALAALFITGIGVIIHKQHSAMNTTIISGQQPQQNIADHNSSIKITQRDTFNVSDNGKVEVTNINGIDPNLVQKIIDNAFEGQRFAEKQALYHQQEKEEYKKQLTIALNRIKQLEVQGSLDATEVLKQLRESGNTEKLQVMLVDEINRHQTEIALYQGQYVQLNREVAAVAYLRGHIETSNNAIDEILKLLPDDLQALNQRGHIHALQGRFDEAIECYQRVFQLAEQQNNLQAHAGALENLGNVYFQRGDFNKAEEMYKKALDLFKQTDSLQGQAQMYGNLGVIYQTKGDMNDAEQIHLKSLDIFEQIGSLEGQAKQYSNLGSLYVTKAIDTLKQTGLVQGGANEYGIVVYRISAPDILEQLASIESHPDLCGNPRDVYTFKDNLKKAENMFQDSLNTNQKLGRFHGQAINYANLGSVWALRGNREKAKENWKNALAAFNQIGATHMAEKIQSFLDSLDKK